MPEERIFMFGIKSKACRAGNLGTSQLQEVLDSCLGKKRSSLHLCTSQLSCEVLLESTCESYALRDVDPSQRCCVVGCATGMSRKGLEVNHPEPQVHLQQILEETWGNIPRFRSCWKRPIFTENSWDYWDHGPIQRKMLELKEKKVPLKTSEEKCCVLQ